jgi:hypothetical protein
MSKLITTPKGTALWTSLNKPDTKWKAEGVYEVKLAFDGDDEAVQKLVAKLEKLRDEKYDEIVEELKADGKAGLVSKIKKVAVFEVEEDPETGEETGRLIKKFKMTASGVSKKTGKKWTRKPKIFNARGVELTNAPSIGSGSVLKISFDPFAYYSPKDKEVGCSTRLEAAQVIELVSFGEKDASGYGFGEEDGYDDVPQGSARDTDDDTDMDAGGAADEDDDI